MPKSGLFRQKEDQFRSIFSKRSAIRPRSDKADLLGNTGSPYQPSAKWLLPQNLKSAIVCRSAYGSQKNENSYGSWKIKVLSLFWTIECPLCPSFRCWKMHLKFENWITLKRRRKINFFSTQKKLSLKISFKWMYSLVKIGNLQVVQNRLLILFFVWDLFLLQYRLVLNRWFRQEFSKPAGTSDPTVSRDLFISLKKSKSL